MHLGGDKLRWVYLEAQASIRQNTVDASDSVNEFVRLEG